MTEIGKSRLLAATWGSTAERDGVETVNTVGSVAVQ